MGEELRATTGTGSMAGEVAVSDGILPRAMASNARLVETLRAPMRDIVSVASLELALVVLEPLHARCTALSELIQYHISFSLVAMRL